MPMVSDTGEIRGRGGLHAQSGRHARCSSAVRVLASRTRYTRVSRGDASRRYRVLAAASVHRDAVLAASFSLAPKGANERASTDRRGWPTGGRGLREGCKRDGSRKRSSVARPGVPRSSAARRLNLRGALGRLRAGPSPLPRPPLYHSLLLFFSPRLISLLYSLLPLCARLLSFSPLILSPSLSLALLQSPLPRLFLPSPLLHPRSLTRRPRFLPFLYVLLSAVLSVYSMRPPAP